MTIYHRKVTRTDILVSDLKPELTWSYTIQSAVTPAFPSFP